MSKKKAKNDSPESNIDLPELARKVEAALMSTDRPVNTGKLSEMLENVGQGPIKDAVDSLNSVYEESQRSFRVEEVAGGYQILTLPQYGEVLSQMHKTKVQTRLSPAALETLTIIAYRQPILRADIESIRGVAAGEVVRSLMERHLVKIVGRAEEIGRPMLYGTTKSFLELFGLASLKDLPNAEQLRIPSYQATKKEDMELEESVDGEGEQKTEDTPEGESAEAIAEEQTEEQTEEQAEAPEESK